MNSIEPDEQQAMPVSEILEKFIVSSENKKWLSSLFLKDYRLPRNLEDDLSNFICKIDEEDSNAFKLSFLFDFCVLNSEYFIESKLLSERIKIISALFTQKAEDKPSVFKPYVANILNNIKDCAEKDKDFFDAYQKKLQEIRASSSFEERAVYYVKMIFQNLPKRTYKEGEKPPTQEEINSFLCFCQEDYIYYLIKLIAELEEMAEKELYIEFPCLIKSEYSILAFPFIIYGKELYTCIRNALFLEIMHFKGDPCSLIEKIEIPKWDDKNHIHEIFFDLALKLDNKECSMLMLDKIFEGVNPVDIPYIFFEYIKNHIRSIYGVLLKGGYCNFEQHFKGEYYDVIKPIRAELECLDRALTATININYPQEEHFRRCRLFLYYIEKLSDSAPEDKLELFQELFFEKGTDRNRSQDKFYAFKERTIKDILTSIARDKILGERIFPELQKEADDLYKKFIDVIAKGAAKYPVKLFLREERWNLSMQNDHGLTVFKLYCEKLELKTHEDALFVSEFWFNLFYLEQPFFPSVTTTSYRYSSKLEEEGPFFYKNIFLKFINDEDFICSFLAILQSRSSSACSLAVYCLARWVLYQKNKDKNISGIVSDVKKACELLHNEKITFPDKIAEVIKSYKIPDKLKGNNYDDNEARRFLFYLTAALNGEQYQNIIKDLDRAEEHFPLYYIRYKYSHDNFIPEEFLDFLFNLENPSLWRRKNEFYNLELIQEACKDGVLKKQVVLEKVSDYIEKNRKILFQSLEIKKLITYFFIKIKESETHEVQTAFFTHFCERAVQEIEDSYTELYLFFKIYQDFSIDTILEKHMDINNTLVTRSCKMLNNFRKNIEQKKFPEDEDKYLNEYILPASYFIKERTGNIWKALKPLIMAFRASKDILLDELLNPANNISYLLINLITSFFRIEDQEKLKELRYNMANDFAEYLKPAKNERQAEKYTQKERETEGFDLSYTEPSPYWRYAYVRALSDLGVKTDKRGHYFHKILENVSEKDPSEDVKSAAKKVMKELDSIREGYSGKNHKKCLFEAFWWLKYEHMLSLDAKVDNKAWDMRTKEWR
jgi:hypothetical protein